MNKEKYKIIKTIIFIIIGTLLIVFSSALTNYAHLLVGALMIMYGTENLLFKFLTKDDKGSISRITNDVLLIILGVVALFLGPEEHFKSLCIIWATWAILREEWEIEEAIKHYGNKVVAILSIIESIIVIVLCVFFIFEPTLKNVHIHIILLGIELILEVIFPILGETFKNKKE